MIATKSAEALDRAVVLFDFDGVIIDSEVASFAAWSQIFSNEGVSLTIEDWLPFIGVTGRRSPVTLLETLSQRPQPHAQCLKDALLLQSTAVLPCRAGVLETIQDLVQYGVELFIVSNAKKLYIQDHLERLGLDRYFLDIMSGEELPAADSKQQLYAMTRDRFGLLRRPTVAVEDSEHGVRCAQSCGLCVLWFPNELTINQDVAGCSVLPYPQPLNPDVLLTLLSA
jgi:beta-phosphoglucomutase-like phosphatase (HAD superfamily)